MKLSSLVPGVYFDGKKGLRLLVRCEGELAVYQKVRAGACGAQVLPGNVQCPAADFARWARVRLETPDLHAIALTIAARAVSLTPEQARALLGLVQGQEVRGKVRTSLLEKELVSCHGESAVLPRLTELGIRVLERLRAPIEKKT